MGKKSRIKNLKNPPANGPEKARITLPNHPSPLLDQTDPFLILFLILSILMVYAQTFRFDFVYDDAQYITLNTHVLNGLNFEGIKWAFTAGYAYNWHPLTWLSHMIDYQLFGNAPGYHHMMNVLFHMINSALLYLVMKKLIFDRFASLMIAVLFALHPLNVESVAWVSERKNLICTLFFFLALYHYTIYAIKPSASRYAGVLILFIAGLLAKPMIVTFPFLLLLLDVWPLNRAGYFKMEAGAGSCETVPVKGLILEKIPFLAFSLLSSVITVIVQKSGGAVRPFDDLPLDMRLINAVISYTQYIYKLFIPLDLCVLYPLAKEFSRPEIFGSIFVLILCFSGAVFLIKKRAYVTLGWLWYVGTLVPMIGIVQVGNQAMADRYAYISFIGLFMVIALSVSRLFNKIKLKEPYKTGSILLVALPLILLSYKQTAVWKENISLYEHALSITENNSSIHNNLGQALYVKGEVAAAMAHWEKALAIHPAAITYFNIGNALDDMKKYTDALGYYLKALELNPDYVEVHNNLGVTYIQLNNIDKSIYHLKKALSLDPESIQALTNLKKIQDYLKINGTGKSADHGE